MINYNSTNTQLFKIKDMCRILDTTPRTFRKNFLNPVLELEREKGIKSGVVIHINKKKYTYDIIKDIFLNAIQYINKEDVCNKYITEELRLPSTKGGNIGISNSIISPNNTEEQLNKLLNLKL